MPRDSSGVFTLVDGYEAVTGETIQPSQHNPPLEDIASALTGSLPRNGSAPMLAPVKLPDGSAAAPTLTFNAETGSGFFRVSNGVIGLAIGGVLVTQFTVGGVAGASVLGQPVPLLDDVLPPLCVWADGRNISRSTYSALFARWGSKFGAGDGSTTFGVPDMRGAGFLGRDNIGGTDAGRLAGVPAVSGNRLVTGSVLGEVLHALTGGETGPHFHGFSQAPNFNDVYTIASSQSTWNLAPGATAIAIVSALTTTTTPNSVTINGNTTSAGSGTAHNNVQRSFVGNWAIFAGA